MLMVIMADTARNDKNFWLSLPRPIMAHGADGERHGRGVPAHVRGVRQAGCLLDGIRFGGRIALARAREACCPISGSTTTSPAEHPIVAQIFGGKPEQFEASRRRSSKSSALTASTSIWAVPTAAWKSPAQAQRSLKTPARAKEIIRALKARRGRRPARFRKDPARLCEHRRDGRVDPGAARRRPGGAHRPPPHPQRDVRRARPLGAGAKDSGAPRSDLSQNRRPGQRRRPLAGRRPRQGRRVRHGWRDGGLRRSSATPGSSPAGRPASGSGSNASWPTPSSLRSSTGAITSRTSIVMKKHYKSYTKKHYNPMARAALMAPKSSGSASWRPKMRPRCAK